MPYMISHDVLNARADCIAVVIATGFQQLSVRHRQKKLIKLMMHSLPDVDYSKCKLLHRQLLVSRSRGQLTDKHSGVLCILIS